MQSGFIFGIIGAIVLLIGVFVPLVNSPLSGAVSLFHIQEPVAILLLVIAAVHLIFCINRVAWGLYATKLGVLAAIALGVYRGWDKIAGRQDYFARLVKPIVKVHWGTGLLAAGILILMAAAIPRRQQKPDAEPKSELPITTEE